MNEMAFGPADGVANGGLWRSSKHFQKNYRLDLCKENRYTMSKSIGERLAAIKDELDSIMEEHFTGQTGYDILLGEDLDDLEDNLKDNIKKYTIKIDDIPYPTDQDISRYASYFKSADTKFNGTNEQYKEFIYEIAKNNYIYNGFISWKKSVKPSDVWHHARYHDDDKLIVIS